MFSDYVCVGNSNKYPTVVMSIKMNPALVDVNVEPNKTKVYLQLKVYSLCSHITSQDQPWLYIFSTWRAEKGCEAFCSYFYHNRLLSKYFCLQPFPPPKDSVSLLFAKFSGSVGGPIVGTKTHKTSLYVCL